MPTTTGTDGKRVSRNATIERCLPDLAYEPPCSCFNVRLDFYRADFLRFVRLFSAKWRGGQPQRTQRTQRKAKGIGTPAFPLCSLCPLWLPLPVECRNAPETRRTSTHHHPA